MANNGNRKKATVLGFCAILMWGALALLSSFCGGIPPFQLTAMTFAIAFLAGIVLFVIRGMDFSVLRQPPSFWLNGLLGLFGYHALYFMAMKLIPSVEVNLIAYLWPVLIVLISSVLPGERLRWLQLSGVIVCFLGVTLLLLKDGAFRFSTGKLPGYLLALACAIVWALYSINSSKQKRAPTVLIGAYCGMTAVLSFICHLLFEKTVHVPAAGWAPVLLLGLGPVGLAFFAWDHGVKNGSIKLLSALSYTAPLLSSILLVLFGKAAFSWGLVASCALIALGSALSAGDMLFRQRAKHSYASNSCAQSDISASTP